MRLALARITRQSRSSNRQFRKIRTLGSRTRDWRRCASNSAFVDRANGEWLEVSGLIPDHALLSKLDRLALDTFEGF